MLKYNDYIYYNTGLETYGTAYKLSAGLLRLLFIAFCLATPATNWLIPIVTPKIKDYRIRW